MLIGQAVYEGARRARACAVAGIHPTTEQRWRKAGAGCEDGRRGPHSTPANKLTAAERELVVQHLTSLEFRNQTAEEIVVHLADRDEYVASESTFRRIAKQQKLDANRRRTKTPRARSRPKAYTATGPLQVLSWDITYLKDAQLRGGYFYLYMHVDVWSRAIVGWSVEVDQTAEKASRLLHKICGVNALTPETVVLHQDNGAPMRGRTFVTTMEDLGITKSYSRARCSDDNPYIESFFRHLKYAPSYPTKGFSTIEAAREWVEKFVHWYNNYHLHSGIGYVTPNDRHNLRHIAKCNQRNAVYDRAQAKNPQRWSGKTRVWNSPETVTLNPAPAIKVGPEANRNAA